MLLSIVVNLSSTVNGTQSALQATSPLGPWFHYTVPPKQIPGLFQSIRQHLPAYTATRFSTESTLLAAPARIISACGFCHLKRFFFSSAHFASNIKHSFNYWHVFYPAMCNSLLFLYILEAKQAWEHEFWSLSNGHKTKARDKFVFWSQSQRHIRSGSSQTAQFARKGWRNCDPWTSVFSLDSIWVHFLKVLLWVKVPRQKPQGLWHLASRS